MIQSERINGVTFYRRGGAGGAFNDFISDRYLEQAAAFIDARAKEHCHEWEFGMVPESAHIKSIIVTRTVALSVDENTLYFDVRFSCDFVTHPISWLYEEETAEESQWLDVIGTITFFRDRQDFHLDSIHVGHENVGTSENYRPDFPGIRVNQLLYPQFDSGNEEKRKEQFEAEGRRFLERYYPQALETECPVPIRRIMEEEMDLTVYPDKELVSTRDMLGTTSFKDQWIAVVDEETGEEEELFFRRGSVLMGPDTFWTRGFSSWNYTLAHESYHWYRHRVHMAFMQLSGIPEDGASQGHLEIQAQAVAARILMPRESFTGCYRRVFEEYKAEDTDDADAYELAVADCAKFFEVSKQAVRIRLDELGLHNYHSSPAVRRRIDIVGAFEMYADDKKFRRLLDSGRYCYRNNYVVKNDPLYVQDDGLTDYAKTHIRECTLIFREKRVIAESGLLHRAGSYSLTMDYDNRMLEDADGMKALQEKLVRSRTAFEKATVSGTTPEEYLLPIIMRKDEKMLGQPFDDDNESLVEFLDQDAGKKKGGRGKKVGVKKDTYKTRYFLKYDLDMGRNVKIPETEVFQARTLLQYKNFEEMRSGRWDAPSLQAILTVCVGYHLTMEETEKALLYGGYILIPRDTRLLYRFLISQCRDQYEDTDTFNTLLMLFGEKKLLGSKGRNRPGGNGGKD